MLAGDFAARFDRLEKKLSELKTTLGEKTYHNI
jgi:hypothetical protein